MKTTTHLKRLLQDDQEKGEKSDGFQIAIQELVFQNQEKENRAAELVIANKELAFQNKEKENRAAELVIANTELAFQNEEKEKRAAELTIANKELVFQKEEKERDEQERIKAKRRLEAAQQIAHMGSWELDFASNVAIWSDEACKICGMDPADNRHSLDSCASFIHPEDLDSVLEKVKISFGALRGISFHHRIVRRDGIIRYIYSESKFELDSEGKPTGLYGIAHDVTERKQSDDKIHELNESLERKVEERTAQLQEINNDLEAFSYSVSHDLRSPLQVISGFSSILSKKYSSILDDQAQNLLTGIKTYTKQMSLIMENLINLSRLGRASALRTTCSMGDIVGAAVEELKILNNDVTTKIELKDIPDSPCDAGLAKQVWVNLISNAIKYSKQKANPFIEIGSTEVNDEIVYFVKDNGVGFDMKYADKLFDAFHRLHKTSDYEGTGIGLTIVHRIISKHGGRIWAESKPDRGAAFYFTLTPKIAAGS